MSPTPLLSVRRLRIEFPTRRGTLVAIDDVSFDIAKGEVLGMVGESGAGKSLTGAAIIGLLEPPGRIAGGEILLHGEPIHALSAERMRRIRGRRIAMIFQDPLTSLNPLLTIGRQLTETILTHLDVTPQEARQRAVALLDEVGIPAPEQRIDHYPHQFSGGMRQRIMIAMAIALDPHVLIADEPTTALDVTVQAQIMDLLKELQAESHMGLILITHDLGVVADVADRIAVMYAGRLVEKADVRRLYADPAHPYTLGLLESIPRLDQQGQRLNAIGGLPPNLTRIPAGCPFHPRCRFATAVCRVGAPPPLVEIAPGREAACHHVDEVVGHHLLTRDLGVAAGGTR